MSGSYLFLSNGCGSVELGRAPLVALCLGSGCHRFLQLPSPLQPGPLLLRLQGQGSLALGVLAVLAGSTFLAVSLCSRCVYLAGQVH